MWCAPDCVLATWAYVLETVYSEEIVKKKKKKNQIPPFNAIIIIIIVVVIINNNNNDNEYLWNAQIQKSALGALHVKIPTYINRHIQENKIN